MQDKPLESDHSGLVDVRNGTRIFDSATEPALPFTSLRMLKLVSLVLLTLQNAVLILVMHHVRTREGPMFMATSAVIVSELFKLLTALAVIFYCEADRNIKKFIWHLQENIVNQPMDCLKVSVPSLIYIMQNNLLYVALTNLDAATFQVTYQLKILTTALFSVIMLNKHLSKEQWASLVVLFTGVALVQLQPDNKPHKATSSEVEHNPLVGLAAVLISCLMSGFAGVYFEKILKGTKQSIWLRNVQLSVLGVVIGAITMLVKDGEKLWAKGFFYGYDYLVFIVILLNSFGGLLVAVVVKYADNILKGFATSAAIIVSCVASIYIFDFQLSLQFTTGALLVIVSVYIYSKFVPALLNKAEVITDKKSVQKI
ncbi:hypothetical protein FSP39_002590 [Pinctada imbricata]|uniref:UDP-galactose translocator n=1 Tax=Pinctada imbricata TaxID=66713 RepID=A0AA89BYF9_PINIB|nr:hypothetical protein FSP39_002590 [Pinctada imbricata]